MSENEVRDLEKELTDEELHARYTQFKNFCTELLSWENPSLPPKKGVYFTDHGPNHSRNVINYLNQLTSTIKGLKNFDLSDMEKFLLLCAAWSHDLGMQFGKKGENWLTIREKHHERSAEFLDILSKNDDKSIEFVDIISNLNNAKKIYKVITPFSGDELNALKNICEGHCSSIVLNDPHKENPLIRDKYIRQHFLIALIRIADICDVSKSRAPEVIFDLYRDDIPEDSISHWEKHQSISGVKADHDKLAIVLNCDLGRIDNAYLVYFVAKSIEKELLNIRKIFGKQRINIFGVIVYDFRAQSDLDNLELLVEPPDAEKITESLISELEKLGKPFKNIQIYSGWNSSGEDYDQAPNWYIKLISNYKLYFTYYKIFYYNSYPSSTHFELLFQPYLKRIRIELHLEKAEWGQEILRKLGTEKIIAINDKLGINVKLKEDKGKGRFRGIGEEVKLSKPIFRDDKLIELMTDRLSKYIEVFDPLIFELLGDSIKQDIKERFGIDLSIKVERKETT